MYGFIKKLGGRKMAYGFYASVLLTVMAFPLDASFTEYAGALCIALGLTAGSVALEDTKGKVTAG